MSLETVNVSIGESEIPVAWEHNHADRSSSRENEGGRLHGTT